MTNIDPLAAFSSGGMISCLISVTVANPTGQTQENRCATVASTERRRFYGTAAYRFLCAANNCMKIEGWRPWDTLKMWGNEKELKAQLDNDGASPTLRLTGYWPTMRRADWLRGPSQPDYFCQSSSGVFTDGAGEDRVKQQSERSVRLHTILDGESQENDFSVSVIDLDDGGFIGDQLLPSDPSAFQ